MRVRAPHDDADAAHRTLPSLGSVDQVEAIDPEFPQEMVEDFKRIRAFAKRHASDMSAKQKANIQEMLDRAKLYINDAQTVWEFWAKGFTTPTIGQVPPWPLNGKPQGPVGQERCETCDARKRSQKRRPFAPSTGASSTTTVRAPQPFHLSCLRPTLSSLVRSS